MTNIEKIRQFTDEEFADYLRSIYIAGQLRERYGERYAFEHECILLEWLHKEVTNE